MKDHCTVPVPLFTSVLSLSRKRGGLMRRFWSVLCRSGSEVLFLPSGRLGLLIVVVALAQPTAGLTGLVALLTSRGLASFLRLDQKVAEQGFYSYDPLLVGLAVGYYVQLSPAVVLLAAIAGGLTLAICIATSHLLREFFALPVLSVPFVIGSTLVYLVCAQYPSLAMQESCLSLFSQYGPALPALVSGYFTALGTVFFASNPWAGMVLAVVVVRYSRILFLLSLLGYGLGVAVRAFLAGASESVIADPNGFNFILVAMALGGVFLVPSGRSYVVAAIGVVSAVIVLDAWLAVGSSHGVPPFALPFNVVVLGTLYTLRMAGFTGLALTLGRTPEETLEMDVVNRARHPGSARAIHLPFSGAWTVWQGFDGRWTHQGLWRFAYDFVITDDVGKTHQGSGRELEDYYCYRKPVLSPIAGRVVRVVGHLPDRPIGQTDGAQNWGNAVVIQAYGGFCVEISHFAADSIRVAEGQEVAHGAILGLCGNSGYSPQPHIHIQVQATDQIGAATLPFSFAAYIVARQYFANDLPGEYTVVEAAWPNQSLDAATACHLDQQIEYEAKQGATLLGRLSLSVRMAPDGTFCFESNDGSRLYFGKHAGTYFAYRLEGDDSWLRLLLVALPRLPLGYKEGLRWNDCLPVGVVYSGWRRVLLQLACAFVPSLAAVPTAHRFVRRDVVETRIDNRLGEHASLITMVLGTDVPIESISVGDLELRRVTLPDEEAPTSEVPMDQELQSVLHFDHR